MPVRPMLIAAAIPPPPTPIPPPPPPPCFDPATTFLPPMPFVDRAEDSSSHRSLYSHAPSPPPWYNYKNLPPFAPGAMPPVPGPVFSKAFNALLVLLVIGCVFLGMNLRDAVMKMQASDIGTNNEVRAHAQRCTFALQLVAQGGVRPRQKVKRLRE